MIMGTRGHISWWAVQDLLFKRKKKVTSKHTWGFTVGKSLINPSFYTREALNDDGNTRICIRRRALGVRRLCTANCQAVIIYRRLMDNLYHASKLIRWRDKNHASKLIRWRDNNDIAIPLDNSDIWQWCWIKWFERR